MSSEPTHSQNPFEAPGDVDVVRVASTADGRKQSGLGIASFILGAFSCIAAFALVAAAGYIELSTPGGMDEESPIAVAIGLGVFAIFALNLIGLALAIAGLFQSNRLKVFSVMGLVFNALIPAGLIALIIIGLAMQA